jgi:hypothetical protein
LAFPISFTTYITKGKLVAQCQIYYKAVHMSNRVQMPYVKGVIILRSPAENVSMNLYQATANILLMDRD